MEFTQQEKWYEIHKICHEDPAEMLKQIISTKKVIFLVFKVRDVARASNAQFKFHFARSVNFSRHPTTYNNSRSSSW